MKLLHQYLSEFVAMFIPYDQGRHLSVLLSWYAMQSPASWGQTKLGQGLSELDLKKFELDWEQTELGEVWGCLEM